MIRLHIAEWVGITRKIIQPITPKLVFFVIIFNQDVRPIKIENTKKGGRIVLGLFRGIEPVKVGSIFIDYHINLNLTCIQAESRCNRGRLHTLIKGYLALIEPIQITLNNQTTKQVNTKGN